MKKLAILSLFSVMIVGYIHEAIALAEEKHDNFVMILTIINSKENINKDT